jgi:hydroxymethylbilane synthase
LKIRIATRKSALALWQAEHVKAALEAFEAVERVELVPLSTRGDEVLDRSLQKIGGKGLFIKELEVAMQEGRADIAVHSMKDVPAEMPAGFCIAAVMERANSADALVGRGGVTLEGLREGATVGSSSLRRAAQIRMLRPDVRVEPLRGNVNTRLAKLGRGDYEAIILAAAGLERLGLEAAISQRFSPEQMLPAAAQGVVGVECRAEDTELRKVLARLAHGPTALTTAAERAVARELVASCHSPVAAYAVIDGDQVTVTGLVAMPDGSRAVRRQVTGPQTGAESLGVVLARQMRAAGAEDILAALAEA